MDFKNVEKKYRPIPFWSWNEKLDTKETAEQIDKMNEQGIGGFFMHARGGLETPYMEDEWFDNVETAVKKCEENGMYAWAYDENGWPSGFGAGIVNGMGIEYQQKYLRITEGDAENVIAKNGKYTFYYDVNPFYVDTLDGKVTKEFIDKIYQPYYDKFKGRLEGFFTDEPQISRNGIPWSFIMPEEYQKAYGENLLDVLEELFMPVGDYKNTRVKFWKMVTELFSKNFMKQIYDWCVEHDLQFTGHLVCEETFLSQLASNGACMPHYEYFTIPGMDWLCRNNNPTLTPYQLMSASKQMGRKQVLSETFALCGHNVGHDELKWIYEAQLVRGINLMCQHLEGYSNRGLRKRDYPPAMYIQQPWWEEYKKFNDAMSRIGMILSEGDDAVDVLVIHPQTTAWTMYDDSKECKAAIEEYAKRYIKLLQSLEMKHINFHLGDEIMLERHGKAENGKLVIGRKSYSKVIIPEHDIFFENTEKLLEEFKTQGGVITTVDELPEDDIINIPEITHCVRKYDDFDVYYFVNSTENIYDAEIKCGNKMMDITTGELSDFDGKHTFNKYESLLLIDDRKGRRESKAKITGEKIDLGGEWEIVSATENSLTLDYCDYYFDGILEQKDGYILNVLYRALDKKPKQIKIEYRVDIEYIPENLYLALETPEKFTLKVNGVKIDKLPCGYFRDKSFKKIDIKDSVIKGENIITLEIDFYQSDAVYENLEKAKVFESEKNKLFFDTEIEAVYLVGDFGVKTDGEFEKLDKDVCRYSGGFTVIEPAGKICLENIERQGFPFFAGKLTVKKTVDSAKNMIEFKKCGINVVKLRVNGADVDSFMWEPYSADVSEYLRNGDNEIELTLVNNLRNLLGPFHLAEGETYFCGPHSFYEEKCIWKVDGNEDNWNRGYCFAEVSVK